MSVASTQTAIVKEIEIDAPASRIFAALTEPDQLTQWWGEEGKYRTEQMQVDLRPGGRWRTTGKSADGRAFVVEGVYRVVEPPSVLEFTWAHDWGEDDASETLVRIELTERGGVTLLKLTHSGFVDREARDDHDRGWNAVLEWLRAYVSG